MDLQVNVTPGALASRAAELAAQVATFGPRSVPPSLRREHVLTCATYMFTEHGYEQTSMVDVASMAGAMDELLGRIKAAVAEEPRPQRYSVVASRAYFAFVQERRAAWEHMLTSNAGIVREWVARMQRRHADEMRMLIIESLDASGIPYDAARVDAFAVMLVSSVEALAGWWIDHPQLTADELAEFYGAAMVPGLRSVIA